MKEPYTSHVSYLKKGLWPSALSPLSVLQDCTDNFLSALIEVAFLQEGILLYKFQYFSIYIHS
jgi:hypothetical protein